MSVALVTGASRGIGAAIALRLAAPGVTLGLVTRSAIDSAPFTARGAVVHSLLADVADAAQVAAVIEPFVKTHAPTVLVNNAGITHDMLALRLKEADVEHLLQVNFLAGVRLTRLCLRGMLKTGGRIVSLSSVVARAGNPGQAAYAASKAALEAYTRSLAKEVAERGVTVNCVAPGFITTDMTAKLDAEWQSRIGKEIPLRRFGTPDEVAEVVAFLCSAEASYITGQVVDVTGGLLC